MLEDSMTLEGEPKRNAWSGMDASPENDPLLQSSPNRIGTSERKTTRINPRLAKNSWITTVGINSVDTTTCTWVWAERSLE